MTLLTALRVLVGAAEGYGFASYAIHGGRGYLACGLLGIAFHLGTIHIELERAA